MSEYTDVQLWQHFPDLFDDGDVVVVTENICGTSVSVGFIKSESGEYQYATDCSKLVSLCPTLRRMLYDLWDKNDKQNIVLYGVIYGKGVDKKFRAFDIKIGESYMDYTKYRLFKKYSIPSVPILYSGPYAQEVVQALASGTSKLSKDQVRKGIVITSAYEEEHPAYGRKILKWKKQ
jgi:hypothetical protein